MSPLALLDTGVIGLLTHANMSEEARRCTAWLARIRRAGVDVKVPLISYYEIRREMTRLSGEARLDAPQRARWGLALAWLDTFTARMGIAGIDVKVMRLATDLWAEARRQGLATASDSSLDADVILAGIARRAARGNRVVRVVTTNVGHISRYVAACRWDEYPTE